MQIVRYIASNSLFLLLGFVLLTGSACRKDSKRNIIKHHRQETGESAHELLSDKKYEKLTVEIQYMVGYRPSQVALSNLEGFLNARLHKKDGIQFVYSEIPAEGKGSYSLEDIVAIEDKYRNEFTRRKDIATYFVFVDGDYVENSGSDVALGIAYYNTSMVMFQKTILDYTGNAGQPDQTYIETVVLEHEFGHIMGLVNLGSDMQTSHQDTEHGNHCSNEDCLMNWEVGGGSMIGGIFGSGSLPALDQDCLNDLKANGGK